MVGYFNLDFAIPDFECYFEFNSIDFGTVPEKKIFLHELKKKR